MYSAHAHGASLHDAAEAWGSSTCLADAEEEEEEGKEKEEAEAVGALLRCVSPPF